VPSSFLF